MSLHPMRLLVIGLLVSAGCARQDAEILTRVGKQLSEKAQNATAGLRERLPFRIVATSAAPTVPDAGQTDRALTDRVQLRLANDKLISGTPIQVTANGAEV